MDSGVPSHPVDRLEGAAPAIEGLRAQIRHLAAFDVLGNPNVPTLLVQGETGTGKGLVARLVHDSGPRAGGPFVPVNCAAIPDTMLEAEIFGHEPGAFTDAKRGRPGLFEAASGGTLFLDEIDSLDPALQSKLLTVIESKRVRRLGAVAERAFDVKLIAASQRDLAELAAGGRFRADLYHRLAVVVLRLPPLRERGEDVVALGSALLERLAIGYGARPKRLTADAEEWLRRQSWPGNVRELGHLMERVTLLEPDASVDARGLERLAVAAPGPAVPSPDQPAAVPADPPEPSRHIGTSPDISGLPAEAQEVRDALVRSGGNVVQAARLLGVSRDTIRYRMRRHGLTRPELTGPTTAPRPSGAGLATSARPSGEGLATTPRSLDETAEGTAALASPDHRDAGATDTAPPRREAEWEQKMVAVVAVSLAWTEGDEGTWSHEPWTEHQRWARLVREKLSGLGAVPLQDGASVSLWAVGLPRTVDQLLERAVHGALAIREVVASLAPRERGPELRMAIHQGAMLVPVSAPDPARGALAVGNTIALPIALLGEAGPGEAVASADVGDRVAAWARVEQRHAHGAALAGQVVYRIDGMRPWRDRGSSGRLTPFVGRDRELVLLEDLATAAAAGAGQIAGIVAPPGAGKSRLLRELRRRVEARGIAYEEAHALAQGTTTPLLPFVEMARSFFDVTESDSPEIVWPRVRAGLVRRGLDPDTEGPHLVALLTGQTPPDHPGETAWRRTFDLVRHFVVAGSAKLPLVLAIDNAHWLDPTS